MQSFIVLGIVPGTSFQLTFNFWLYVAILLAASPILRASWRRRNKLREYAVALTLARFIDRYQLPA
jgi:hypothetical protein